MPTRSLPANPNLDQLKHQAKDLHKAHRAKVPAAAARIREHLPQSANASDAEILAGTFTLTNAQQVVAREYGFASWPKLKAHVESIANSPANLLARCKAAANAGDAAALRGLLQRHPALAASINKPMFAFDSPAIVALAGRAD